VGSCDTSGIAGADLALASEYLACAVQQCPSECGLPTGATGSGSTGTSSTGTSGTGSSGTGTSGTSGSGGTSGTSGAASSGAGGGSASGSGGGQGTGEPCAIGVDTERGSCTTMDYQLCKDAQWTVGDCAGCGIVVPTSACSRTSAFTLEQVGDEWVGVPEAETTYTQTESQVSAVWYLEAGQAGVIQFEFVLPIDPARIDVSRTGTVEFVTLENAAATGGCQYTLASDGRLARYVIVNISTGNVDWYGCWGVYETNGAVEPTDLTVMNIRTPPSPTNEQVSLSLSTILF
jgi:hypothetical protein